MRLLPDLEWLYFGQLPMRVVYSTGKKRKVVETLFSEMDDCWTFLQEIFNGGADWQSITPMDANHMLPINHLSSTSILIFVKALEDHIRIQLSFVVFRRSSQLAPRSIV